LGRPISYNKNNHPDRFKKERIAAHTFLLITGCKLIDFQAISFTQEEI
jgi:hypothetical protein